MKNLMLAIATGLFAFNASATSIQRAKVIATAQGDYKGLTSVSLLEDGRIQMINTKGVKKQFFLSAPAFSKIERDLSHIANIEVQTITKDSICLTFRMPFSRTLSDLSVAKYDYESQSFTGQPELKLSNRGCYVQVETFPVDVRFEFPFMAAREQLVILALEQLKDDVDELE